MVFGNDFLGVAPHFHDVVALPQLNRHQHAFGTVRFDIGGRVGVFPFNARHVFEAHHISERVGIHDLFGDISF